MMVARNETDALTRSQATDTRHVHRLQGNSITAVPEPDALAVEIPLAIEINGISHATLLVSPTQLEELVLGFLFTEGIVRGADDLFDVAMETAPGGLIAHCRIAAECMHEVKRRRRHMAGRTGCGLCGVENLEQVHRALPRVTGAPGSVGVAAILSALDALRSHQTLHQATGATHAAAWATPDGTLHSLSEDVGRHNALDKLIGSLLMQKTDRTAGFCLVSSRASFEMVQKAAAAQFPALVAVSAATSMAVQLADDLGMLLTGFARDRQMTVYTHARLLRCDPDPNLST
jgi:FdhD protein